MGGVASSTNQQVPDIVPGCIKVLSPGRLQVSKQGLYLCTAQFSILNTVSIYNMSNVRLADKVSGGERSLWFSVNGSAKRIGQNKIIIPVDYSLVTTNNINEYIWLNENDYVSCYYYFVCDPGTFNEPIYVSPKTVNPYISDPSFFIEPNCTFTMTKVA